MSKEKLSYNVKKFSDKVRILNQTNSKSLTMTVDEARNLQSDIFDLLSKITELTDENSKVSQPETLEIKLDGGTFDT